MQPKNRPGKSASNVPFFRGTARNVEFRTDIGSVTKTEQVYGKYSSESCINNSQVLTFRVELTDKEGNIIKSKQVRLEGEKILGTIHNGDLIEVIGEESISGIHNPFRILNRTTETEITTTTAAAASKPVGPVAIFIGCLFWLVLMTTLLTIFISAFLGVFAHIPIPFFGVVLALLVFLSWCFTIASSVEK